MRFHEPYRLRSDHSTESHDACLVRLAASSSGSSEDHRHFLVNVEEFQQKIDRPFPGKAIALAIFLFVFGSLMIILGSLLMTGHFLPTEYLQYSDRAWPLLILGGLMFIPGSYHVFIAYGAFTGREGYSYEDIPEFSN